VLSRIAEARVAQAETELAATASSVKKLTELCQDAVAALDRTPTTKTPPSAMTSAPAIAPTAVASTPK
jgi:hypothetical protein